MFNMKDNWIQNPTKYISKYFAQYFADKRFSKDFIPFMEWFYQIDTSRFVKKDYKTLNEWFKRDLIDITFNGNLSSPCEAFIMAYRNINSKLLFQSKNKTYSLEELLGNLYNKKYDGGTMLVFRLEPKHYHNFHHIIDGKITNFNSFDGKYYPVNRFGMNYFNNLYVKNRRDVTNVETAIGNIVYCEIGAFNVGSIVQYDEMGSQVVKYNKKGFFQFGGSSVIIVFEKDKVQISEEYNHQEKYVNVGDKIGSFNE
jgi:phosphatidylserine decarboxylase